MRVKWLCNCSTDPISIYDLNLCRKCHRVSCRWCQKPELLIKFCPGCSKGAETKNQMSCNKNCFECPRCQLAVSVSMRKQGDGARCFELVCNGCLWKYTTPAMTKARPLTQFVKELQEKEDPHEQRFMSLRKLYRDKIQFQNLETTDVIDPSFATKEVAERLNNMKLFELVNEEYPLPIHKGTSASWNSFPRARALRGKFNYRCPACGEYLTKCHPDPKSSRFMLESFAMHQLPDLQVVSRSLIDPKIDDENSMALVFKASSSAHVATDITIVSCATAHIPVRQFTLTRDIPSRNELTQEAIKRLASEVPTFQLNTNTKILAAEKSRRNSKVERTHKNEIIDQGNGWCVIPMYILEPTPTHKLQLTIPIEGVYVTFQVVLST